MRESQWTAELQFQKNPPLLIYQNIKMWGGLTNFTVQNVPWMLELS